MSSSELLKQLKLREADLTAELDAVRKLISVYEPKSTSENSNRKHTDEFDIKRTRRPIIEFHPKGDTDWRTYTREILEKISIGKANDVAAIAIKANPDMLKDRVKSAITSKLSKMYRDGEIEAEESAAKNVGFIYKIKKES